MDADIETRETQETDMSVDIPCEHPAHGTDSPWHADGDPHYIRFTAKCGHYGTDIKVVCGWWATTIRSCWCDVCDVVYPAADVLVILGPVKNFR